MKKLLLATLMMLPTISMAYNLETCKSLHGLAKVTMEIRQDDRPIPDVIALFQDYEDEDFKEWITKLTYKAYKQPLYNSQEFKEKAVSRFANQVYLECAEFSVK